MSIINGIRIGQYDFNIDTVPDELKWRCINSKINYAAFSAGGSEQFNGAVKGDEMDRKFLELAEFMAENKIYFSFSCGHSGYFGVKPETLSRMKAIAGDYFMGCFLPELGSMFGCKALSYPDVVARDFENMQEAKDSFVDYVNDFISRVKLPEELKNQISIIEATCLLPYVSEAATSFPMVEAMCGNPEIMLPMVRGVQKAHGAPLFITYIAHEWYAGNRNDDPLKGKRLRMIYDYAYMCGSDVFLLESGDLCIFSHGMENDFNNELSQHYRTVLREFAEFAEVDNRPQGGPKVKVAFIQGNLDGWSSWNAGSSLWNQFGKPQWGYSAPEFSWRIMDDINVRRSWHDVHNYGAVDLSGAPAYGQYDVINANSSLEAMKQYDYLIFTGWNTMTEEIYNNLKAYVQQGGILLMAAAHLNTNSARDGELSLIRSGDVSDLFGCVLDGDKAYISNGGFKFYNSIIPHIMYPADDMRCDPILSSGYVKYAKSELKGGRAACLSSHYYNEDDNPTPEVAMIENKLGKGYAVLLTSLDYPGAGAVYPLYKTVVRELITASHRECAVQVYGSDRLRFAVYEGDRVYLLNTDFDSEIIATVKRGNEEIKVHLNPCEMKSV